MIKPLGIYADLSPLEKLVIYGNISFKCLEKNYDLKLLYEFKNALLSSSMINCTVCFDYNTNPYLSVCVLINFSLFPVIFSSDLLFFCPHFSCVRVDGKCPLKC